MSHDTSARQTTPPNPAIPGGSVPQYVSFQPLDLNQGSVGLNHDDIVGLMPAMQMEFYVTDKALLKGLAVVDKVDFVIAYKGGRETINRIKKTR